MLDRLRRLATGPAAIYLAASVLSRAGAFVLIPLYTKRLTIAEYGDYSFAHTLIGTLPTFLSLGLISAIARFHFDGADAERARARVGDAARWLIVLTIATASLLEGALLLLWPGGRGVAGRWELSCVIAAAAGSAIAVVPAVYLRAAQRPIAAAVFQIVQFFSVVAGGLTLVWAMGRGLTGAIEAAAIAYVVDGLIAIGFVMIALPARMTRATLREALKFSLPFVPHFAALQLQQTADRWILKLAHMEDALGAYGLANQLISPANMALMSWNDASSPVMGEAGRQDGKPGLDRTYRAQWKSYALAAFVPVIGVIGILPIVGLVLGRDFVGALWLVPLLGACLVVESQYFPAANVVFFANRTRVVPIITVGAGLLSVAANYVLMVLMPLGIAGAIASRMIAAVSRSVAMRAAARDAIKE